MDENFDIKVNFDLEKKINYEEIKRKYIDEKMSQKDLANYFGLSQQTISRKMIKFGIKSRNFSDSMLIYKYDEENHMFLSEYSLNFLIGELLGDGNITKPLKSNGCNCLYRHSSKYKEYLNWIVVSIPELRWGKIYEKNHISKKNKSYRSYQINSFVNKNLNEIHNKFYFFDEKKQRYIKRIPDNLDINSVILRQWYIGDGCFSLKNKNNSPTITISCQNHNNDILMSYIEQLKNKGIDFSLIDNGKKMRLKKDSISNFFDYIGNSPIECYNYKWGK